MSPASRHNISPLTTLVLDLGGVIIDIDPSLTTDAFSQLGAEQALEKHSRAVQDPLFDRFEKGEVDAPEFRERIREKAGVQASDQAIDRAWNKLLLDIPEERFSLLERLCRSYELHLFSNTNAIHYEAFSEIVEREYGVEAFQKLFKGIHLSFEMGARKPDPEAFRTLLDRIGRSPENILFIDDTSAHVEAAKKEGIRAWHLGERELIEWEKELLPQGFS